MPKIRPTPTRLMIAPSEGDADMFYATRFFVPDSFVFVQIKNKSHILMNDLEVDRARKQAKVTKVHSYSAWASETSAVLGRQARLIDTVSFFLKKNSVKRLSVPHHFPVAFADQLRNRGFRLDVSSIPFFQERIYKSPYEIRAIEDTQRHTESAVREAVHLISRSQIKGPYLYSGRTKLTSEYVRQFIHQQLLSRNCLAQHTIVACGNQACDPHQVGTGPLRAHQSIILDVFPKSMATNYFADMTRTVVRGKPAPALKRLYQTVKEGQDIGLSMVREGISGRTIHQAIMKFFECKGYSTGLKNGRMQGFFHGTGHGVGLEIHEPPRIGSSDEILKAGMVVTVEPGLYYSGLGGVRLENMVLVEKRGNRNLTRFPRILEI